MTKHDVNIEQFSNVMVFGHPMLFTDLRCDRSTLPQGMYLYEVRHGDEEADPYQIAEHVLINHYGTLITDVPINMEQEQDIPLAHPFVELYEDSWIFDSTTSTLEEYRKKRSKATPKK